MSNRRWRELMIWLRQKQDASEDITRNELEKVIENIKRNDLPKHITVEQ